MRVREAVPTDAPGISAFLQVLAARGKRTLPSDADYVSSHYIANPNRIQCAVAEGDDGTLLGLQILLHAAEDNPYGVTPGWGMIGTHVRPDAARQGVGKALFAATRAAAERAGLQKIDAMIGADNAEGLAYYGAMGFQTYRTQDNAVCKVFGVTGQG